MQHIETRPLHGPGGPCTTGREAGWVRRLVAGAVALACVAGSFAAPAARAASVAVLAPPVSIAADPLTSVGSQHQSVVAFAGGADMISGIFRSTMWNQTIPDDVRGRMAGIELLSSSIGPLLGQVRSSTAASLTSLRVSIASGGLLCIVGVGIAAFALPSLWSYDARTDVNAQRERRARDHDQ